MAKRKAFKATATVMMVCEPESDSMRTGRDIAEYMKDIRTFAQEGFFVLTMDNASRILNSYMVSLGTCTATLVHPREVFRPAVYDGAAAVAFVHNHPSGNPTPSGHDRELTNRLQDAATILGIKVTDHIVIGYERYGRGTRVRWHSFRESGYMD